jgi:dTDP-4-dehydrorhamnose reductase
MKIAVLGSTGMAGHVIAQYLQEQGHQVYRASRSERNTAASAAVDVTDFPRLKALLDDVQPDAVVNCIGLLQKACADRPDQAVLLNAYYPHWLERTFADTPTRVIHLSTDCVFSGARGGYREDDPTDGDSMYDRSKALGELHNAKDLTFRMSIIGPDIDPRGTGLFNWFMSQRGTIQGWTRAIWSGVTTIELARGIDAALQGDLSGLYHLVPDTSIDKYSLLELIRTAFHRQSVQIDRVDGLAVDKSLVNTRTDFAFAVRDYPHQIADLHRWVEEHRSLYPHYFQ